MEKSYNHQKRLQINCQDSSAGTYQLVPARRTRDFDKHTRCHWFKIISHHKFCFMVISLLEQHSKLRIPSKQLSRKVFLPEKTHSSVSQPPFCPIHSVHVHEGYRCKVNGRPERRWLPKGAWVKHRKDPISIKKEIRKVLQRSTSKRWQKQFKHFPNRAFLQLLS